MTIAERDDAGACISARIGNGPPLLRAGLARAAAAAGFQVVATDAPVTLRGSHECPLDVDVEVVPGLSEVTLTLRSVPDRATWSALRTLAGELLSQPRE